MLWMTRRPLLAAIVAFASLSGSWSALAQTKPSGDPILVGVVAPTSGDYASLGADAVNGILLAEEQINQKGGILGRPLKILVEDGAADPTTSLNAVTKLTTRDKVIAILGTLCSGCTLAVLPTVKAANVLHFTIGDGSTRIAQAGNPKTFLITDSDEARAQAAVDAFKNFFKVKNVGILVSEKSEPGKLAQHVIEKALAGTDIKVTSVSAPTNAPDYKPFLTTLRDAGAQIVFDGGSAGEEMAFILRQMQDLNMKVPTIGMLYVDTIAKNSGEEAASSYYFTTPYLPSFDAPETKSFTAAYQTKFKNDPSRYSAIAYSSIFVLASAIELARSTDPDAITPQVRKVTWVGPLGKPDFDAIGFWSVPTHIARYQGGKLSLVYAVKK